MFLLLLDFLLFNSFFFFFNDPATTEIYTLSLHDALPISCFAGYQSPGFQYHSRKFCDSFQRSEEHTSELQSRLHLVCRLLLEKKKKKQNKKNNIIHKKHHYETTRLPTYVTINT